MNSIKRIMAALLVSTAGFGLFVACGPSDDGCTFDADCADTEACEAGVCVPTCETDEDCAAGEVCEEGQNTDKMVCKADTSTNGGTNGQPNGDTNGDTNGMMGPDYYLAQIVDTSSGDDSCMVDDPGSDIMAIGLEDGTGTPLGWARPAWDEIVFEGNMFTGTDQLDGNAPDLQADQCVDDFNSDTVTALGCGGWMIVEFLDDTGTRIPLENGQEIRVYEYGAQCSTGSTTDTYSVSICEDTMGAGGGDDSSCTIQVIVDGSAETSEILGGL
jgi:hypothetical protein